MKKNLFLSSTAIAAAALTAFFCYKSFTPQLSEADILLNENIEALTQNEDTQKCTRVKTTGTCYKNNMFFCIYVKTVEEYTVSTGSPIICQHAVVTTCPSGTYPKD